MRRLFLGPLAYRFALAACLVLSGQPVEGQQPAGSPAVLIRGLTRQSAGSEDLAGFQVSCGYDPDARQITRKLVQFGTSAIPDIDMALDSLISLAFHSPFFRNAAWLLYAYAEILGPEAFPRLRRMTMTDQLNSLVPQVDVAISIALGLTSYVDEREEIATSLCHYQDPHDALDLLILAWEKNDLLSLDRAAGRDADASRGSPGLGVLGLRRPEKKDVAIGYRFDTPGAWSMPPNFTIAAAGLQGPVRVDDLPSAPVMGTVFYNGGGVACGRLAVAFVRSGGLKFPVEYHVDSKGLNGLLRIMGACAAE